MPDEIKKRYNPRAGQHTPPKPRDYKHEYEVAKKNGTKTRTKLIGAQIDPQMAEDFVAKCELNGTTKNALIKKWIEQYTYGSDTNTPITPKSQRN